VKIFIEVVTILLVILLGGVHATPLPPPPEAAGQTVTQQVEIGEPPGQDCIRSCKSKKYKEVPSVRCRAVNRRKAERVKTGVD